MYELIELTPTTYCIENPARIGIIKTDENRVCLIDSGLDKEVGKKVRKIIDSMNWKLEAIFNTHSHADHIGGNKYLQDQTSCLVYAPTIECAFVNHPELEPTFLFGSLPIKELQNKFLCAQASHALELTEKVLPNGLTCIELPGHSMHMMGYRTADDVVFLADSLASKETLEKYKVVYLFDVGAHLETLDKLKNMQAKFFVPSHAPISEDISELVQYNIDKTLELGEYIYHVCSNAISFENLLQKVFEKYNLKMSLEQNLLIGSTIKSYLSWLKSKQHIEFIIENNCILWKKN